jgi:hypothetical protein
VGVVLYEAFKQRQVKGYFDRPRLAPEDLEILAAKWLNNK